MHTSDASTYSIQVNEQHQFDLDKTQVDQLDFVVQQDGSFHILQNGKSYRAEIIHSDFGSKKMSLQINGKTFEVSIADHYDRLVKQLGLASGGSQKVNEIKAPMPGLVLNVEVNIGQKVKKGDGLLILEAMKMENVIKSAGDGIIKEILIEEGMAVDKGQLLIQLE